jgi:putative sigma-54 modulation protein
VVVSIQRGRHFAEVTLKADRSELYSNATTKDMYSSVDEMITKIEHQIKKYKEKLTSHPRKLFNELKHGERNL